VQERQPQDMDKIILKGLKEESLLTSSVKNMAHSQRVWCMTVEVLISDLKYWEINPTTDMQRDPPLPPLYSELVEVSVKQFRQSFYSTSKLQVNTPYDLFLAFQKSVENPIVWEKYLAAEARINDESVVRRVFDRNCLPLYIYKDSILPQVLEGRENIDKGDLVLPKGLINGVLKHAGVSLNDCPPSRAFAMRGIYTTYSVRKSTWLYHTKQAIDSVLYLAVMMAQIAFAPVPDSQEYNQQ
jgi:hypothetical protein